MNLYLLLFDKGLIENQSDSISSDFGIFFSSFTIEGSSSSMNEKSVEPPLQFFMVLSSPSKSTLTNFHLLPPFLGELQR